MKSNRMGFVSQWSKFWKMLSVNQNLRDIKVRKCALYLLKGRVLWWLEIILKDAYWIKSLIKYTNCIYWRRFLSFSNKSGTAYLYSLLTKTDHGRAVTLIMFFKHQCTPGLFSQCHCVPLGGCLPYTSAHKESSKTSSKTRGSFKGNQKQSKRSPALYRLCVTPIHSDSDQCSCGEGPEPRSTFSYSVYHTKGLQEDGQ